MDNAMTIAGICVACVLARFLLELVGEALLQITCYWTARIVVPALTFGRVSVASLGTPPEANRAAHPQKPGDGRRVISFDSATGIGVAIWLIAIATVISVALWWPGSATG